MLKSFKNQFKTLKEIDFIQDLINKNVCALNLKIYQKSATVSVATETGIDLQNPENGELA